MPSQGNCYLCGKMLGKVAMKNHLLKVHNDTEGDQRYYLLKAEGLYDKDYWLYFDIPVSSNLSAVDQFLRNIWLECCGHMSAFTGPGHQEIGKNKKLYNFSVGTQLVHEYDFGSTTESKITFVAETVRAKQKNAVRLLARNVPPEYSCSQCGRHADYICAECMWEVDNPVYCAACVEEHEHEMILPVTNSPRMGVCGYEGEYDRFTFVKPELLEKY